MSDQPPKRPTVAGGKLWLPDGRRVALETPEWDAWLAQALAFDVDHPAGAFLVAREKRQRGGLYWVARRYDKGRRASVYLGSAITSAALTEAGEGLAAKIAALPPAEAKPRPGRRGRAEPQGQALVGASDPTTMRTVVEQLLAQEADPARRAALEALQRLVASVGSGHEQR